jgi:tetratricopeptide (TPR) repeat protein
MATLIEEAKFFRQQGRYDEACEIARKIISADERNADAWWNLGLAQNSLGKLDEALDSLKVLLKLSPKFAAGWTQFGLTLAKNGQLEQAQKALEHSLTINPNNEFALEQAAILCGKIKDHSGEISYLTRLDAIGKSNGNHLNSLGVRYWEKNHFSKALEYYKRSAAKSNSTYPYYNLALVYNHNEVSQDIDAIDCLERALRIDPGYEKAKELISLIKPRLEKLARTVLESCEATLPKEDFYRFYINPFELLVGIDQGYQLESFDAKTIKNLKNKLFQEIELEDGSIHYVENLSVDKSKAIEICENLNDESLKRYHWLVFKEPRLLSFLSRGDIHHFLCIEDYKPLDLLGEFNSEESEFKKWLSPIFAKQYDLVLTRALKNRCVPLIESLFDGRRWVLAEHEEICFGGAKRQIDSLLDPLRSAAKEAEREAPTIAGLEAVLQGDHLTSIVNLLPEPFRDQQNEAVSLLRSIAIKAFNEHGDAANKQCIDSAPLTVSHSRNPSSC